jgi:hypothetical protein
VVLTNFTTAWNRVIATAVERGFISERVPVPKLTAKGMKGKARPGFSEDEIKHLLLFMDAWQHEGVKCVECCERLLYQSSSRWAISSMAALVGWMQVLPMQSHL